MTLHKLTDYHGDTKLLDEIRALLAPSYERYGHFGLKGITEPVPGMQHEMYTLRDDTGQLAAFYTVGYHDIAGIPCGYLGLSAVRDDCKGLGLAGRLYSAQLADCRQREAQAEHRILLYFTTATPLVFDWFTRRLAEVAPGATGNCDLKGLQRLCTVAATRYPQSAWETTSPYLLRHAAPDMGYSAHEGRRLDGVSAHQLDSFFNSVALDERNGDRLLVVGYAPRNCDKPTAWPISTTQNQVLPTRSSSLSFCISS